MTRTYENPKTAECLSLVRQELVASLPRQWSFDPADLDKGIEVLGESLDAFLNEGGSWEACALWVLTLAESISHLSVALSTEAVKITRPKANERIDGPAFFLAAVLVCNACHGELRGRACSRVKVDAFPNPDGIRDLFRKIYADSGLPIG